MSHEEEAPDEKNEGEPIYISVMMIAGDICEWYVHEYQRDEE